MPRPARSPKRRVVPRPARVVMLQSTVRNYLSSSSLLQIERSELIDSPGEEPDGFKFKKGSVFVVESLGHEIGMRTTFPTRLVRKYTIEINRPVNWALGRKLHHCCCFILFCMSLAGQRVNDGLINAGIRAYEPGTQTSYPDSYGAGCRSMRPHYQGPIGWPCGGLTGSRWPLE